MLWLGLAYLSGVSTVFTLLVVAMVFVRPMSLYSLAQNTFYIICLALLWPIVLPSAILFLKT
jgi:hypothetical protein